MDEELIDELCTAADDAGAEWHDDYSGRGMYGAECFAIYGNISDLIRFLRNLDDDLADKLSDPSVDNMGYDYVYYWPHLETRESKYNVAIFENL